VADWLLHPILAKEFDIVTYGKGSDLQIISPAFCSQIILNLNLGDE
jgi:hypothetical protein